MFLETLAEPFSLASSSAATTAFIIECLLTYIHIHTTGLGGVAARGCNINSTAHLLSSELVLMIIYTHSAVSLVLYTVDKV